jgi:hypothetical protein
VELNQNQLQRGATTLLRASIAEKVIVNVLSAWAIGLSVWVLSLLVRLYQQITNSVVVPTNVLNAIGLFGVGALIMLVVVGVGAYVAFRVALKHSTPFFFAMLMGLIGYGIATMNESKASSGAAQTQKTQKATPTSAAATNEV